MTIRQIASQTRLKPAEVESDLEHLARSLVHGEWRMEVTVSHCRKCGFQFGPEKLRKPSKCPECKGTWLSEPEIALVPRGL